MRLICIEISSVSEGCLGSGRGVGLEVGEAMKNKVTEGLEASPVVIRKKYFYIEGKAILLVFGRVFNLIV